MVLVACFKFIPVPGRDINTVVFMATVHNTTHSLEMPCRTLSVMLYVWWCAGLDGMETRLPEVHFYEIIHIIRGVVMNLPEF